MTGRLVVSNTTSELLSVFDATGGDLHDWHPSWNIKPTETVPVIIHSATDGDEAVRRLESARWSLTPSWSTELKTKFPTFNARAEGITDKATWRGPIKTHRALVPATGYYEWQTDLTTKKKTPFYEYLRVWGPTNIAFGGRPILPSGADQYCLRGPLVLPGNAGLSRGRARLQHRADHGPARWHLGVPGHDVSDVRP
ncbi:SOS response-associated peptidase family protein [Cryobacterium sp. Y29]|uniref:SOS response-associated peptidase n=1 Tax=Cryobacterium sp. Y29 TaxID=2048285 RepID=UPI000CE453A6